jgi:outer membrane protein assembly factor BamB
MSGFMVAMDAATGKTLWRTPSSIADNARTMVEARGRV